MPITTPTDPDLFLDGDHDTFTTSTASAAGSLSGSPLVMDLGALADSFNGVLVLNVDAVDTSSGDETYFVAVEGSDGPTFTGSPQTLQSVEVSVTGQFVLPVSAIHLGHFYRYLRLYKTIGGTTPSLGSQAWLAPYSSLPDLTLAELIAINGVASANLTQLSASLLAWATGTPTGGPGGDGRYPLNDAAGNSFLVDCPAKTGLQAANNLDDVADPATARTNLDVYSTGEVDDLFADVYSSAAVDAGFVKNLGDIAGIAEGAHLARPAAGTAGRYYVETDTNKLFRDNGTDWVLIAGGGSGGGGLWIGTVPPPDPVAYPFWWNSDASADSGGVLLLSYNDGDSTQWVSASPTMRGDKGDTGDPGPPGVGVKGDTGPTPWDTVAAWVTATSYIADAPSSVVTQSGATYICAITHTSGTFAADLAAGKWLLLVGAQGVSSFNTRTGAVTLSAADVTGALSYTPVNKAGDTMSGLLVLSADPAASLGAATKQYVDNLVAGLSWKTACAAATTANITLSGEQTIDGVTTSTSRVLVKNQSTASQNGIYVSASGAWARAADMDAGSEFPGGSVLIKAGTAAADTQWVCTNTSTPTVGATAITFAQFSSGTAGTTTTISATAPTSPNAGDRWWVNDTTSPSAGREKIWVPAGVAGTNGEWVDATPVQPGPQGVQGPAGPTGGTQAIDFIWPGHL